MTVSVHVRPISTDELRGRLLAGEPGAGGSGGGGRVLLVDSRPFMQYNEGHIAGAHNVHCPRLLRRRSKGALSVDCVVTCPETRAELQAGLFAAVAVYDRHTRELGPTTDRENSDLILVLESLLHAPVTHLTTEITFLQGGFEKFRQEHPSLCTAPSGHGELMAPAPSPATVTPLRLHRLTRSSTVPLAGSPPPPLPLPSAPVPAGPANAVPAGGGEPVQILPHVYLGDASHAGRRDLLRAHGITAVLNVSRSVPNYFLQEGALAYKSVPVDDDNEADLLSWFPEAIEFIDAVKSSGGSVLIHCHAGISRSATVCLAYLMKAEAMRLEEAFEFVRSLRKVISPNFSFMLQLLRYEAELGRARAEAGAGSGGGGSGGPSGPESRAGVPRPRPDAAVLPMMKLQELYPAADGVGVGLGSRRGRSASLPCLARAPTATPPPSPDHQHHHHQQHHHYHHHCTPAAAAAATSTDSKSAAAVFNFAIAPPCGWQRPDRSQTVKPICSPS